METKIGKLQQSYAYFDYCGEIFVFENDDCCDVGFNELMSKYIMGDKTDEVKVQVTAKDGEIVITRL